MRLAIDDQVAGPGPGIDVQEDARGLPALEAWGGGRGARVDVEPGRGVGSRAVRFHPFCFTEFQGKKILAGSGQD